MGEQILAVLILIFGYAFIIGPILGSLFMPGIGDYKDHFILGSVLPIVIISLMIVVIAVGLTFLWAFETVFLS